MPEPQRKRTTKRATAKRRTARPSAPEPAAESQPASDGYVVTKATAKMNLTGDFKGAWIEVNTEMTLGDYFDQTEMGIRGSNLSAKTIDKEIKKDPKAVAERVRESIDAVRDWAERIIVDWNLKNPDGSAMPVSGDSFIRLPAELRNAIQRVWRDDIQEPDGPLESASRKRNTSRARSAKTARKSRRRRNT